MIPLISDRNVTEFLEHKHDCNHIHVPPGPNYFTLKSKVYLPACPWLVIPWITPR